MREGDAVIRDVEFLPRSDASQERGYRFGLELQRGGGPAFADSDRHRVHKVDSRDEAPRKCECPPGDRGDHAPLDSDSRQLKVPEPAQAVLAQKLRRATRKPATVDQLRSAQTSKPLQVGRGKLILHLRSVREAKGTSRARGNHQ